MKISDIDIEELAMEIAFFYENWTTEKSLKDNWDELVFYRQYKYEALAEDFTTILKRMQSKRKE